MGMTRISFDVPEDVLLSLNESEMEKTQFLFELDNYAVPAIDYDAEDFRREIDRSNA
jgi:hypothetical protein